MKRADGSSSIETPGSQTRSPRVESGNMHEHRNIDLELMKKKKMHVPVV